MYPMHLPWFSACIYLYKMRNTIEIRWGFLKPEEQHIIGPALLQAYMP